MYRNRKVFFGTIVQFEDGETIRFYCCPVIAKNNIKIHGVRYNYRKPVVFFVVYSNYKIPLAELENDIAAEVHAQRWNKIPKYEDHIE